IPLLNTLRNRHGNTERTSEDRGGRQRVTAESVYDAPVDPAKDRERVWTQGTESAAYTLAEHDHIGQPVRASGCEDRHFERSPNKAACPQQANGEDRQFSERRHRPARPGVALSWQCDAYPRAGDRDENENQQYPADTQQVPHAACWQGCIAAAQRHP